MRFGTVIAAVPVDGGVYGGCIGKIAVVPRDCHLALSFLVLEPDRISIRMLPA